MEKKPETIHIGLIVLMCDGCNRNFGIDKEGGTILCPYCGSYIEG